MSMMGSRGGMETSGRVGRGRRLVLDVVLAGEGLREEIGLLLEVALGAGLRDGVLDLEVVLVLEAVLSGVGLLFGVGDWGRLGVDLGAVLGDGGTKRGDLA